MFGWLIGRNKGFQPNTIPNMRLWLDATRINQSNNTAVATWADQSGNGYDATQGSTAARPTFIASGLNGLPVVRFDGTDDSLALGASALGMLRNVAGATVFLVVKYSNTTGANRTSFFLSNGTSATSARIQIRTTTTPRYQVSGRRLDADSSQNVASNQATSTTNFVVQSAFFNYQNTLLQQYINGAKDGEKTDFQTAGNTSNTDSAAINIGTDSSSFLNGDIAEIIVYNRALNTSELAQVHRYLARKWGIQLA
jgi:hypothetical protein